MVQKSCFDLMSACRETIEKVIIKVIQEAGEIARSHQCSIGKIKTKKDDEPVTEIDIKCERVILRILQECFPRYNYYGEEHGFDDRGSEYTFVIDPIDGTRVYIDGGDWYSVIVGLLKQDIPYAGGIYVPNQDDTYFSCKGCGTYLNGQKVHVTSQHVAVPTKIHIATAMTFDEYPKVRGVGFDGACVSCGLLDGMVKRFRYDRQPVELPALYSLVTVAGGTLTHVDGAAWYPDSRFVIMSNGLIHQNIVDLVQSKRLP